MTQEEKQLLLVDLCARLPYGVKVELHNEVCTLLGYFADFVMLTSNTPMGQQTNIANIKPYLRPMSSMTEEEAEKYNDLVNDLSEYDYPPEQSASRMIDWLNAHHFDYRGLIPMGLALEAKEGMYKSE